MKPLSNSHPLRASIFQDLDSSKIRAISRSPDYNTILNRIRTNNETFLDLGCCFGQDIRRLVNDEAPQSHLYGADLRPEFFDLGYKLFRDASTLKAKFLTADIFDPSSPLEELEGKVDIIYAGSFLHLFNYETQVVVCKRIVKLREKKGAVVLERQAGNILAGEKVHRTNQAGSMFQHNEESFRKMWVDFSEATGTEWRVDVEMFEVDRPVKRVEKSDRRAIRFSVWRE
jgi:SAM-dependent methyltransferase